MKKIVAVKVCESFHIAHFGIVVFLENPNEGLATGTLLQSQKSNAVWIVTNRIIEFPNLENPFDNETVLNSYLHFSTLEKRKQAENNTIERQKKRIYHYQLEGIKKPEKNEVLAIITPP
ncbi:hypothetical protein [Flavobacterium sp. GCM10027622]|uniref:hypothetical protein n=1 Tax=unclassified Flavobacterium TaxID=196869 RepID=UPI00361DFAC4